MPPDAAGPRTVIVRDPDDTPDTAKLLGKIDNLDRGVLVVHPTPGITTLSELALAVLAALGKQLDARPKERSRRWWPLARAWTAGHQIEHVVVDRAHTLPAELIHQLIALAHATQATTWFIDAHMPDTAPALTALDGAEMASLPQLSGLADVSRSRPSHQPATTRQIPPLSMPRAGFLTFRYACERQLPARHVSDVDAAWRATFDTTESWILRTAPYYRSIRPSTTQLRDTLPTLGRTLSVRLAALLYTAANPSTALLRLRATEAALFRYGLLLRHQPQRTGGHDHLLQCPLTPIAAATINRTVSTNAAAAAVLHLVYPRSSADHSHFGDLQPWRVDNVHPDGSRLLTEYGSIPIPAAGQPLLRAHLHALRADGRAAGHAPLIDQQRNGQAALAQQVLATLKPTPPPRPARSAHSGTYLYGYATAWMADRGLSLHALTELRSPDDLLGRLP